MPERPTVRDPMAEGMHPHITMLFDAMMHNSDNHTQQIAHLQSTIKALPDKIGQSVGAAVSHAIANAAGDDDTWVRVGESLNRVARDKAGGFLFGGLKAFFTKAMWVALFLLAIYSVGGWSVMVGAFKMLFAKGT